MQGGATASTGAPGAQRGPASPPGDSGAVGAHGDALERVKNAFPNLPWTLMNARTTTAIDALLSDRASVHLSHGHASPAEEAKRGVAEARLNELRELDRRIEAVLEDSSFTWEEGSTVRGKDILAHIGGGRGGAV
jgi:hypothetical protein